MYNCCLLNYYRGSSHRVVLDNCYSIIMEYWDLLFSKNQECKKFIHIVHLFSSGTKMLTMRGPPVYRYLCTIYNCTFQDMFSIPLSLSSFVLLSLRWTKLETTTKLRVRGKKALQSKVKLISKPAPTHIFKLFPANIWIFKFFIIMILAVKMCLDNTYGLLNIL